MQLLISRQGLGIAPIALLRRAYFFLRAHHKISHHANSLNDMLVHASALPAITLLPYSGRLDQEVRRSFRSSISRHLYGSHSLFSLRLKYSIATYCKVNMISVHLEVPSSAPIQKHLAVDSPLLLQFNERVADITVLLCKYLVQVIVQYSTAVVGTISGAAYQL
jgi:hypothetical protein